MSVSTWNLLAGIRVLDYGASSISLGSQPVMIFIIAIPIIITVIAFLNNKNISDLKFALISENLSLVYLIYMIVLGFFVGEIGSLLNTTSNLAAYYYISYDVSCKLTFWFYLNILVVVALFTFSFLVLIQKFTWETDLVAKYNTPKTQQTVNQMKETVANVTSTVTEKAQETFLNVKDSLTEQKRNTESNIDTGKRFCTQCGAALKPGSKFCTQCGTKIKVQE